MKKTIYILAVFLLLLIFYSCSRKAEPAAPVVLDTIITFVSGEAYVVDRDGEREAAEIGERLLPEYELVTMEDSYLEFKIGSSGVIRMDSNTTLALSDFSRKTEKDYSVSNITLSLAAGTVIQKVKKLTGNETYHVKTASAAFGVRGTEFLVKSAGGTDTLAVGSGSVIASLFPEELEKLKEKADSGDEEYKKIYESLENSFPLLGAGEEIALKKADIAETGEYLKEISILIDKADAGEVPKEEAAALIEKNAAYASEAAAAFVSAAVSGENIKALKHAESFNPEEKTPDTELYIKTEPAGAAVYFDGNLAGYGNLKALFTGNRVINIRVEKEGYYPFEKEINTQDIKESPYVIALEKKSGAVSLTAYPEDAEITIEGIGTFEGKYSGQFDPGTGLSVTVEREEYKAEKAFYLIEENSSINEKIILEPMLIPLRFDSGLDNGFFILKAENNSLLSAGNGSGFSFFSQKGIKKWNTASPYTGAPVISGNSLFFTAENSLEKINLSDGSKSGSIDLADSKYREAEIFEGLLFINSGTDVFKVNPDSFAKERVYTLPDSIVSNPYYYKGKLYSITDKGVLHVFGENEVADSAISVTRGNPEGVDITASGNRAYFAGLKGEIFAMNIDSADFIWDSSFESDGTMPEISIKENKVVLESGRRLSFFSRDGDLLFTADAAVDAWEFTQDNEFAYLTKGSILVICSGSDGSVIKKGQIEEGIKDFAVVNGRIYAVMEDGTVIAVNPDALK